MRRYRWISLLLLALVFLNLGRAAAQAPDYWLYLPYVNRPAEMVYLPMVTFNLVNVAQQQPPTYSNSYYMHTVNTSATYSLGCTLGVQHFKAVGTQKAVVILDFGSPTKNALGQFGAGMFWYMDEATIAQITNAVKSYTKGYWDCVAQDMTSNLIVGIGTTNYGTDVTYEHGAAWAQMVNEVNSYLKTSGYYSQVQAVGAIDAELSWSSPIVSRAWVNGYDSVNKFDLYNYGALEGCATRSSPNRITCSNGWTREDAWYVSFGTQPAFPLPLIYANSGVNAEQWALLSLYSVNSKGYPMDFIGPMTQMQACLQMQGCDGVDNTPDQGWTQLWQELIKDPRTAQIPPYVTDILWLGERLPDTTRPAGTVEPDDALIAQLEKAVAANPNADELTEKLQILKQRVADISAARQNPAPRDPLRLPAAPATVDSLPPTGIFNGHGGAVHAWEAQINNAWQGEVNGQFLQVFAGADANKSAQGVLLIRTRGASATGWNIQKPPQLNGSLSIVSFEDGRLTLLSQDETSLTYNLIRHQWE